MFSEFAKELVKIHDQCLEYENNIVSDAEELEIVRNKAYRSMDKEEFKLILPWLNAMTEDIEAYKEYLTKIFSEGDGNETD